MSRPWMVCATMLLWLGCTEDDPPAGSPDAAAAPDGTATSDAPPPVDAGPSPDAPPPPVTATCSRVYPVLFTADDGAHGRELWRTDGTPEGTALFADVLPGAAGSYPRNLGFAAGAFWFATHDDFGVGALWRVPDGASAPEVVLELLVPLSNGPAAFVETAGGVLFHIHEGGGPSARLFVTDGTTAGTIEIATIPGGEPRGHAVLGGVAYFFATAPGPTGMGLWRSDGTEAGTALVTPVQLAGPAPTLAVLGGALYFPQVALGSATEPVKYQLWRSDGTAAGTTLVAAVPSPTANASLASAVTAGDQLFFHVQTAEHGDEVWRSDGTEAGTELAVDLVPGPTSASPTWLTPLGDELLFFAQAGLWRTDGTAAGTVRLSTEYVAGGLTLAVDRVYYVGASGGQVGLWVTDGADAGHFLGAAGVYENDPMLGVSTDLLAAVGGGGGKEPWRSDGSAAGTSMLADVASGAAGSDPADFTATCVTP